jgi:hypothetical protein
VHGRLRHADLIAALGADPSTGRPFGYFFAADNTAHVVFRSAKDGGGIHDLKLARPAGLGFVSSVGAPRTATEAT